MSRKRGVSTQTLVNWLVDAALFVTAVLASLTGIYFLFLPVGGRNPTYGLTVLFERHTWDDLHTWSGVLMIIIAVVHLLWHWRWIKRMGRRLWNALRSGELKLGQAARFNLALNLVVGVSFLLTAVSGIYFLLLTSGGYQGGHNSTWDPSFIYSRTTWDLIHTWAGVVMIAAAIVHFAIHWRWVKNVSAKVLKPARKRQKNTRVVQI